jgi:hypothetical protein
MNRIHSILKALALATVPVVGAFLIWALWPVHGDLIAARQQAAMLAAQAGAVLGHADAAALRTGKLIDDSRMTVSEINRATLDERKYFEQTLPGLTDRTDRILDNLQTAAADLHGELTAAQGTTNALTGTAQALTATVQTATGAIAAEQPRLDALLAESNTDLADFHALLSDPNIPATTRHIEAITGDAQLEADKFTHPPPQHWWQKTYTVALKAGVLLYDFIR